MNTLFDIYFIDSIYCLTQYFHNFKLFSLNLAIITLLKSPYIIRKYCLLNIKITELNIT